MQFYSSTVREMVEKAGLADKRCSLKLSAITERASQTGAFRHNNYAQHTSCTLCSYSRSIHSAMYASWWVSRYKRMSFPVSKAWSMPPPPTRFTETYSYCSEPGQSSFVTTLSANKRSAIGASGCPTGILASRL